MSFFASEEPLELSSMDSVEIYEEYDQYMEGTEEIEESDRNIPQTPPLPSDEILSQIFRDFQPSFPTIPLSIPSESSQLHLDNMRNAFIMPKPFDRIIPTSLLFLSFFYSI